MFAQLGQHVFKGLKTPASWNETHGVKIGRIPRVNTKDAIQKTGDELVEISLSIRYESVFCVPDEEIAALKKTMQTVEVLPFILGTGEVVGQFIITGIDVTNEAYTPAGRLESATVAVKLLEYPSGAEEIKPSGTALKSTNPETRPPALPVASPANEITTDLSAAKSNVTQMKATVTKAKKGGVPAKKAVRDVKKLAATTGQLYKNVKTKVEVAEKIKTRAGNLPTSLDGAIQYAENLSGISDVADLSVLEMNVNDMAASTEKVSKHAAPVVSFSATREGGK